jgi:hypothetical protein
VSRVHACTRSGRALLALAAFTCILSVAGAQESDDAQRLAARLARPDTLCGTFEQTKTLAGIRNPVRSNGRFCVVAGKAMLWRTLAPFPSNVRITRDAVVELRDEGVTTNAAAVRGAAAGGVGDALFGLLAGDVARLAALFDIRANTERPEWRATLTPRLEAMRLAVTSATVNGDAHVRSIVILEAGGDRTEIRFTAIATGHGAVRPDEVKLLG